MMATDKRGSELPLSEHAKRAAGIIVVAENMIGRALTSVERRWMVRGAFRFKFGSEGNQLADKALAEVTAWQNNQLNPVGNGNGTGVRKRKR